MPRFKLIPDNPNVPFLGLRKIFFAFSLALVVASIGIFSVKGMKYGIDFTGGIMIEVKTAEPGRIGIMRDQLKSLNLGAYELQEFGAADDILIRVQAIDSSEKAQQAAVSAVKQALGDGIEYRRTELVGPKVSDELFWNGLYAMVSAIMAILIYIWFRFEWQFGLGAVVALTHDVVTTIGVFSLIQHEFNLATVAAVLTIAGYSINDTVVVFDRVRENLRKFKKMGLAEILNLSINETLGRTMMTSVTTLLALIAMFTLGGDVIRGFVFAMIWGVIVGTYSSVFVASAILLRLGVKRDWNKPDANAGNQYAKIDA